MPYQNASAHPVEVGLQLVLGFLGASNSKEHSVFQSGIRPTKHGSRNKMHTCTTLTTPVTGNIQLA